MLLLKISVDLIVKNANKDPDDKASRHGNAQDVFSAARTIILADVVMSLDNVLALSAITQNNWQMLVAGLLLSIPILMFGSLYISRLLDVFPYLLWGGAAILGGVSGALIIEDPIFDGVFNNTSSVLPLIIPLLAAGFVVQISRVIVANAQRMHAVARPPSLFEIFWPGDAMVPHAAVAQVALPEPVSVVESPAKPVAGAAVHGAPAQASSSGEYRVVVALGLFMVLTGGGIYYMLNMVQPAAPEQLLAYVCKQPSVTIGYAPGFNDIHLANSKVLMNATVVKDRIVWDDYGAATAQLSFAPPVKIVSADAQKLQVSGGAFDNTTCSPTPTAGKQ
jgi:hypothetical protein